MNSSLSIDRSGNDCKSWMAPHRIILNSCLCTTHPRDPSQPRLTLRLLPLPIKEPQELDLHPPRLRPCLSPSLMPNHISWHQHRHQPRPQRPIRQAPQDIMRPHPHSPCLPQLHRTCHQVMMRSVRGCVGGWVLRQRRPFVATITTHNRIKKSVHINAFVAWY